MARTGSNQIQPGDDNGGVLGAPGIDDTATDDRGGVVGGHGADDTVAEDRSATAAGNGTDDTQPDDHGGAVGGHGADDPAGAPHQSRHFSFTDTATNTAGDDDGAAYTGPVTYLQHEYGWSGHDGRAVSSNIGSAFVHGGDGDDAIAVIGGNNVLDGGGGSNFLVGAHGDDGGSDVFFVDLRNGGTVWDTVVNFHHGDGVTIWGFKDSVSTVSWTENDGVDGYRGATLHSEVNGPGTGVNASVTFAGLTADQAKSLLSSATGNVGGNDYLYMRYDG